MKKFKVLMVALVLSLMAIPFVGNSWCAPGSIPAPNQGTLIPYKENGQLLGELCVWGSSECNCIGMVYWY